MDAILHIKVVFVELAGHVLRDPVDADVPHHDVHLQGVIARNL